MNVAQRARLNAESFSRSSLSDSSDEAAPAAAADEESPPNEAEEEERVATEGRMGFCFCLWGAATEATAAARESCCWVSARLLGV